MQHAILYGAWLGNDRGLSLAVDPSVWLGQFHQGLFVPNRCISLNPWFVIDEHKRDPNAAERWTMRNLGVFQQGPISTTALLLTETAVQTARDDRLEHLGYFLLSELCNEYSEPFQQSLLQHLKRIDQKSITGKSA